MVLSADDYSRQCCSACYRGRKGDIGGAVVYGHNDVSVVYGVSQHVAIEEPSGVKYNKF